MSRICSASFAVAVVVIAAGWLVTASASAGPMTPPTGSFTAVSVGNDNACALRTDATITCWGYLSAVSVPPPGSYTAVRAGSFFNCGIRTDATIACAAWGTRTPPAGTFVEVSLGHLNHACAIRTDTTVVCWGVDSFGNTHPPAGGFVSVATSMNASCGVKTDATLTCWGSNLFYQATPPAGSFVSVDGGLDAFCALRTDATLACWGYDYAAGYLAPPAGTFTEVSVGGRRACARRTNATLICWGHDPSGRWAAPAGTYSTVSVGSARNCAIRPDASILCWPSTGQDPDPPTGDPPAGDPPAGDPPAGPGAPNPAPGTSKPKRIPAKKAFKLPSAKRCVSRRHFRIRVRKVPGVTWVRAKVLVNGKRVKTVRRARITAPVDLRGLPKGRYVVRITAWSSDGRKATGKRRYRTCAGARL